MANRAGQQLGNYRLLSLLGQGGFAEVYLAEHVFLKKSVAVKVLHTQLREDDLESFLQEARTIAHLEHAHIVRVTDFGLDNQLPYLVMEFAPNGTLRHRYPRGTQLPLAIVSSYVQQVADALQYAHDEKLVHRDIKPENMLLNRNNNILLSDFGIATVAHRTATQNTQSIAGTASYMAPELFRGKSYPASDQYALGVVVYEWLTGWPPFREGDFIQLGYQHTYMLPEPLREKLPGFSRDVEQVVLTALEKDHRQRFGSVKAFAHAFEQARLLATTQAEEGIDLTRPAASFFLTKEVIQPLNIPSKPAPVAPSPFPPVQFAPPFNTASPSPSTEIPLERQSQSMSGFISPLSTQKALPQNPFEQVAAGAVGEHTPLPAPVQSKRSRRAILIGLGVAGVAIATGAGITWFADSSGYFQPSRTSYTPSSLLYTFRGHFDEVTGVSWSPDGKRIASASYDAMVAVWDAADGGHVFKYKKHTDKIFAVAWSPDGKRIVSGSFDRTAQVWDATDGGNVFVYKKHTDKVLAVAWSPDGKRIASGSVDKTVQIWDATNGSHVITCRGHEDAIRSVAWSPDGKHIASASYDHTVQIWDTTNGSHIFTFYGHAPYYVNTVAWSPDGQYIVSGSEDGTAIVWNATTDKQIFTLLASTIFAVAWSPNGQHIVSGGISNSFTEWNAMDGSNALVYNGHTNSVAALAWAQDGKRIASGSWDYTVKVWGAA